MSSQAAPQPLRVALLGAGTFASSAHHAVLSTLLAARRIHIVLVWSRTASSARALAASYSPTIPFYHQLPSHPSPLPSATAALARHRPALDAAILALPPGPQERFAAHILSMGLHVMLEKPLALDLPAARHLLAASRAAPTALLALAENLRFEPALHHARVLVRERCGSVVAARLAVQSPMQEGSRYGRGWRLQMDGPGILLDGCVHHIAALRVLLDCDVAAVTATCSRRAGWFKGYDTVAAALTMADGVDVSMFVTYAAEAFVWELRVIGTQADVIVERLPWKRGSGYRVSTAPTVETSHALTESQMAFGGIDAEFNAFLRSCVTEKMHPELAAAKGFNDLAAVFAMVESSENKVQVVLETDDTSE